MNTLVADQKSVTQPKSGKKKKTHRRQRGLFSEQNPGGDRCQCFGVLPMRTMHQCLSGQPFYGHQAPPGDALCSTGMARRPVKIVDHMGMPVLWNVHHILPQWSGCCGSHQSFEKHCGTFVYHTERKEPCRISSDISGGAEKIRQGQRIQFDESVLLEEKLPVMSSRVYFNNLFLDLLVFANVVLKLTTSDWSIIESGTADVVTLVSEPG